MSTVRRLTRQHPVPTRQVAADLDLSTLRLEQTGRVLIVRVDAPPFNYMTVHMQQDFARIVAAVSTDETIGAVVVTGAPAHRYITHFEIGDILDSAEAGPHLKPPAAGALLRGVRAAARIVGSNLVARSPAAGILTITGFHDLVLGILRSPAVWIAAVNGPCGGGGLEMSVFFDIRLAAENHSGFVVPELTIGLTTTVGGQRLAQLVGPSTAMEMMLEARVYTAHEAHEMGLVNRVVPDEELLDEATALATRYATRPRATVAAQKRIFNEAASLTARESLTQEGIAQLVGVPSATTRAALRRWLDMQDGTDGDSVFLTRPEPWVNGTALDLNP